MDEEIEALERNHTWEMVELPRGQKAVSCKWVYTPKYRADGTLERYKARLVARGFTQSYGIDYFETFAPVAKFNTIKILISLAAHLNWTMHQLDVKNAFLHGEIEEEVYMNPPPGYNLTTGRNLVCKLKKALYGLKQSPRAWFGRFTQAMKKLQYSQSNGDSTMFFKKGISGKLSILIVYVDDIIITGDDTDEVDMLKQKLAEEFDIKSLGTLRYFLGIEVAYSRNGHLLVPTLIYFRSPQNYRKTCLQTYQHSNRCKCEVG